MHILKLLFISLYLLQIYTYNSIYVYTIRTQNHIIVIFNCVWFECCVCVFTETVKFSVHCACCVCNTNRSVRHIFFAPSSLWVTELGDNLGKWPCWAAKIALVRKCRKFAPVWWDYAFIWWCGHAKSIVRVSFKERNKLFESWQIMMCKSWVVISQSRLT